MSNFSVRRKVRTISKSVIATAIFLLAAVAAAKDWARDVDAAV